VFIDAAAVVAVSEATISGDSARAVVRLWFDAVRNNLPRSVWREIEIRLRGTPAGWRVVKKAVVAAS
jgi:hypothetical protein